MSIIESPEIDPHELTVISTNEARTTGYPHAQKEKEKGCRHRLAPLTNTGSQT